MNIQDTIRSQYLASLEMLKQAVTQCPDSLWADPNYKNEFWQVAYHALFYTHLYLQPTIVDFAAWSKHRPNYNELQKGLEPYSRSELLEYVKVCQKQVDEQVAALDNLDAPSGFDWIPFNKLELQFYNIRHLQQHTGELCERLGVTAGIDIDWVGMKPPG